MSDGLSDNRRTYDLMFDGCGMPSEITLCPAVTKEVVGYKLTVEDFSFFVETSNLRNSTGIHLDRVQNS
jgi:hypothetical protein